MPLTARGAASRSTRPSARSVSSPVRRVQEPEAVLRQFTLWHESEGHSRKTETCYERCLRPFFAYLKSEYQIADLNEVEVEHIRSWIVWLRNTTSNHNRPRSSKTLESYCRQVKAFLRWCYAEMVIDHDPTERLKLPKAEKKHIRVFSDEEIKLLHEACAP